MAVLDGGFPKWQAEGRAIEDGPGRNDERHFTARMNSFMVRDQDQMLSNLTSGPGTGLGRTRGGALHG